MAALKKAQERFCSEYVIDYNGTQAAIRAGYSEKSARQQASRLLAIPEIRARVRELQQDLIDRLAVSQDYVVQQLLKTYERCLETTPVMQYDPVSGQMEETGTYQFDSKGALKALELLGKHTGAFDKREKQSSEGVQIIDDL